MSDDWDSVTVLRKRPAAPGKSEKSINSALQSGQAVEIQSKYAAKSNKGATLDVNTTKLDQETDIVVLKHVSADVGRAIVAGRQSKQMTQKDLAVKINEKPQVVSEYETGKAIPSQAILMKMEKALGIKLRGKDIGQPLTFGKK